MLEGWMMKQRQKEEKTELTAGKDTLGAWTQRPPCCTATVGRRTADGGPLLPGLRVNSSDSLPPLHPSHTSIPSSLSLSAHWPLTQCGVMGLRFPLFIRCLASGTHTHTHRPNHTHTLPATVWVMAPTSASVWIMSYCKSSSLSHRQTLINIWVKRVFLSFLLSLTSPLIFSLYPMFPSLCLSFNHWRNICASDQCLG